jgi:diacylglycerol kinase family enzyme
MAMIVRPRPGAWHEVRQLFADHADARRPGPARVSRRRAGAGTLTARGDKEDPPVAGSCALIVNPVAGGGRALRILPAATAELDGLGVSYQVTRSASLQHARELAAAAASAGQVVVAVGGDGMAGALAGAAAAGAATLGIIPAGRGNDLARVLGIPTAPAAAARLLARGCARRIDLIGVSVPGQPECVVAGSVYIGLPSVAGEIANATRWNGGPLTYPVAALRALAAWQPVGFRLAPAAPAPAPPSPAPAPPAPASPALAPGTSALAPAPPPALLAPGNAEFAGYAVVVANSAYFGAGMMVAPPAEIDDGVLDIVVMRHGSRLAFVRVLLRIRSGSHIGLPQIGLERAAAVTLTVDRPMPAAADGEPLPGASPLPAGTPLTIRARPGALTVLAPPDPRIRNIRLHGC